MNALQLAQALLAQAGGHEEQMELCNNGGGYYRGLADRRYSQAAVYAAVAQAEALTRLAQVCETALEAGALDRVAAAVGMSGLRVDGAKP